jgi:hypothetical protein
MHQNLNLIPTVELWERLRKDPTNAAYRAVAGLREHERYEMKHGLVGYDTEQMGLFLDLGGIYSPDIPSRMEQEAISEQLDDANVSLSSLEHALNAVLKARTIEEAQEIALEAL